MMRKLFQDFAKESFVTDGTLEDEVVEKDDSVEASVNEELLESIDNTVTATESLFNTINHVQGMLGQLERENAPTVSYFTSMEHHQATLKYIAKNLGISAKLPAIEDFRLHGSFKACHSVAVESFTETIKDIWEKIKRFFADFFKKIMLFLKRLVNAELDIESYEKYMDAMIPQLKQKKEGIDDIELHSKLAELLGDESIDRVDQDYILGAGIHKVKCLMDTVNKIERDHLPDVNDALKEIKSILKERLGFQDLMAGTAIELKEDIDKLTATLLASLFCNTATTNDIPDSLLDRLNSSSLSGTPKIQSLIDINTARTQMPKQYNAYLVYTVPTEGEISYFIGSGKIENLKMSPVVNAIKNPTNVINFYEDYKKLRQGSNVARISKIFKTTETLISDVIDIVNKDMDKVYAHIKQVISKAKQNVDEDPNDHFSAIKIEDRPKSLEVLKVLQKSLANLLSLIQTLIKELVTNVVTISKDIQFAMLKYCYDSGRLILRMNM